MEQDFYQPTSGYRFSQDSIELANFVTIEKNSCLADLGAGCGVIGLSILDNYSLKKLFLIEVQTFFLESLHLNVKNYNNKYNTFIKIINQDWRELKPFEFDGKLDYIVVNPPYFSPKNSRLSPNQSRSLARHECLGDIYSLLEAIKKLLKDSGRAFLVYPLFRYNVLKDALNKYAFKILKIKFSYHSNQHSGLIFLDFAHEK